MLGCVYCRTRERLKEWILRLREVRALREENKKLYGVLSGRCKALERLARRYYERADRGADLRSFDEVLKTEANWTEMAGTKSNQVGQAL